MIFYTYIQVSAAKNGNVVVLDGIHRLASDTLAVLQRIIQDREFDLYDGTKLTDLSSSDSSRNAIPIHESFRIIALAEPPTRKYSWLSSEVYIAKRAVQFLYTEIRRWPYFDTIQCQK